MATIYHTKRFMCTSDNSLVDSVGGAGRQASSWRHGGGAWGRLPGPQGDRCGTAIPMAWGGVRVAPGAAMCVLTKRARGRQGTM